MQYQITKRNIYNLDTSKKLSTCPKCSHTRKKKTEKCLMLDWERGLGTCQHCGEVVQLHEYSFTKEKHYEKPSQKYFNNGLSKEVINYIYNNRSITETTLNRFKISNAKEWLPQTQKEVNCICFNYYLQNELINIKFRDSKKNFKLVKDAEKILYNLDSILNTKEAVIVEGEFDALSYSEAGIHNVVSVPNGFNLKGTLNLDYLDNYIDVFENKDKVFIAVDNDEAGVKGAKELIRRIGAEKCYLVDFKDCKDANDYLIKYGKIELNDTIKNAKPVPLENVLTVNDYRSELEDFYINGLERGHLSGIKNFDEIYSTYTSQYTVVTGIPSSGKSDFVDSLCVGYNLNLGFKVAYASPENKPNKLHSDKIIRKIAGFKPTNKEEFNNPGFQATIEHVNNNFFHIDFEDGYDLKRVLKKGAELVKRKGIKVLVIDPFNKVRLKSSLGKKDTEYTNDYLNEIDMFCRKYDVKVFLVAHPVKMQKKENGKFEIPSLYSVKGGSEFYDMTYHGLVVHRDYENQSVQVKVLKIKFGHLGENQASAYFKFNLDNNRYIPLPEYDEDTLECGDYKIDSGNWLNNEVKESAPEPMESLPFNTNFDEEDYPF